MSPVCTRNAGWTGIALILAIASPRVAAGSGFAGSLKPMWLSLICTKLRLPFAASAADASPISPTVRGIPPLTVHKTPAPAQLMHCSILRRFRLTPLPRLLRSSIDLSIVTRGDAMKTGRGSRLFAVPEKNFR